MAEAIDAPAVAASTVSASIPVRHAAIVRVTHWVTAISVVVLLASGVAILLAHPRLYWGETGARGGPSLIDLPLPFVLGVPIRGPGRYLHFTFAWVLVLTGAMYIVYGLVSRHLRDHLVPEPRSLTWRSIAAHLRLRHPADDSPDRYNVVQRIAYLCVVFGLVPLLIWTGLGMSPTVTSVFPVLATAFGGQQSARTIHFFATLALVLFVCVHVVMVWRAGFAARTWSMIDGRTSTKEEPCDGN